MSSSKHFCGLPVGKIHIFKYHSQEKLIAENGTAEDGVSSYQVKESKKSKNYPAKKLKSRKKKNARFCFKEKVCDSEEMVAGTGYKQTSKSEHQDECSDTSIDQQMLQSVCEDRHQLRSRSFATSHEQLLPEGAREEAECHTDGKKHESKSLWKTITSWRPFGKKKGKKVKESPAPIESHSSSYQPSDTISDVNDHTSSNQNSTIVVSTEDVDMSSETAESYPVQVADPPQGFDRRTPTSEQAAMRLETISAYPHESLQRTESAVSVPDVIYTEAVVHERKTIDHNKGITNIETKAQVRTTSYGHGLESIHCQAEIVIEKVPRTPNLWYSSEVDRNFEQLELPGKDQIFFSSPSTKYVVKRIQPTVWSTADGSGWFQLLDPASLSPKSDSEGLSFGVFPSSDINNQPIATQFQLRPKLSIKDSPENNDKVLATVKSVPESLSELNNTEEINNTSEDFMRTLSYQPTEMMTRRPIEATSNINKYNIKPSPTDKSLSLEPTLSRMDSFGNNQVKPDVKPEKMEGTDEKPSKLELPDEGSENKLKSKPKFTLDASTMQPLTEVIGQLERDKTSAFLPNDDYAALISEIARILAEYSDIIAPLYWPCPTDIYKLLVLGPGVSKAKEAIKSLEEKYSDYSIIVSDSEPVLTTNGNILPVYTKPLAGAGISMPCYVHQNPHQSNEILHMATCGTFLKDDYSLREGRVYGVTAAHAVLTKEEQQELAEHGSPEPFCGRTKGICKEVIIRTQLDKKLSIAPHNHPPVRVRDAPYVAYTHYIPTPESDEQPLEPFQKFASDIAILPIDANQLDENVLADGMVETFLSTYSEYSLVSDDPNEPQRKVPIGGYIEINDASDIDRLREANVKLIIDGVPNGKLQEQPKTFTNAVFRNLGLPSASNKVNQSRDSVAKWMIAPHFAFTTDRALTPGKSGSPLMVYNESEDVLYIIGLLMGSFTGAVECTKDVLYQAMPFGPALKQLQFIYEEYLKNLRPVIGEPNGLPADKSIDGLSLGSMAIQLV